MAEVSGNTRTAPGDALHEWLMTEDFVVFDVGRELTESILKYREANKPPAPVFHRLQPVIDTAGQHLLVWDPKVDGSGHVRCLRRDGSDWYMKPSELTSDLNPALWQIQTPTAPRRPYPGERWVDDERGDVRDVVEVSLQANEWLCMCGETIRGRGCDSKWCIPWNDSNAARFRFVGLTADMGGKS